MPRSKRKTGSPVFDVTPHQLSKETRRELENLLTSDPLTQDRAHVAKAMHEIEVRLGSYPGLVKAMDEEPRAADYKQSLKPIRDQAFSLIQKLCALNYWEINALRDARYGDPVTALCDLVNASDDALRRTSGESRGRRKNAALKLIIVELRSIFAHNYQGGERRRRRNGTAESLSQKENDEIDFIKTALNDAAIPHPANLRRIFDDTIKPESVTVIRRKLKKKGT